MKDGLQLTRCRGIVTPQRSATGAYKHKSGVDYLLERVWESLKLKQASIT